MSIQMNISRRMIELLIQIECRGEYVIKADNVIFNIFYPIFGRLQYV